MIKSVSHQDKIGFYPCIWAKLRAVPGATGTQLDRPEPSAKCKAKLNIWNI